MTKRLAIVHHADRRHDLVMPYAPAIVVPAGRLVFVSGVTAAPVYHSHPHREEEFDLPETMHRQAELVMENLTKTLAAAGATLADLVSATRYLTDVRDQDELNAVWAKHLGGHLPTTTTVEVSRLATHARCKLEITVIAVTGAPARTGRRSRARSASPVERGASAAGQRATTRAVRGPRARDIPDRPTLDRLHEPGSARTPRRRQPRHTRGRGSGTRGRRSRAGSGRRR